MILHWRSRSLRGGSGWWQSGLVVVSVGVSLTISVVSAAGEVITIDAADRTVEPAAYDRTIAVPQRPTL